MERRYYIDHDTGNLIIYNEEENNVIVLEEIDQIEFEGKEEKKEEPEEVPPPQTRKRQSEKATEKQGKRKRLTQEEIKRLRKMLEAGDGPLQIQTKMGVSSVTAHKYYREFKKGWKPMPEKLISE